MLFPLSHLVPGVLGGAAPTLTGIHPHPQIIAFDELRTDFKNPIDQGNPARAVSDTCAVLRCVRPFVFLSWWRVEMEIGKMGV